MMKRNFSECDFLHSFVYCIVSVFDRMLKAILIKLNQTLSSHSRSTLLVISSWQWSQKAPEVLDLPEINLSDLSLCLCCCCSLVTVGCAANRRKCVCLTCSSAWICFSLLYNASKERICGRGVRFLYACLVHLFFNQFPVNFSQYFVERVKITFSFSIYKRLEMTVERS